MPRVPYLFHGGRTGHPWFNLELNPNCQLLATLKSLSVPNYNVIVRDLHKRPTAMELQ